MEAALEAGFNPDYTDSFGDLAASCDCETRTESPMPSAAKETRSFTLRVKMGTKGLQSWWTTRMIWVSVESARTLAITS